MLERRRRFGRSVIIRENAMHSMQIIEWGKPLEAREYPDPEPQGEEVLLRVEAAVSVGQRDVGLR